MYVKFSVLPSNHQIIRISKKLWDSDFTAIYLLHTDFIYVWRFLRLYVLTLVRLQQSILELRSRGSHRGALSTAHYMSTWWYRLYTGVNSFQLRQKLYIQVRHSLTDSLTDRRVQNQGRAIQHKGNLTIMVYYGILWYIMIYYDILWYNMVYQGISWYIMVYHGILWYIMVY